MLGRAQSLVKTVVKRHIAIAPRNRGLVGREKVVKSLCRLIGPTAVSGLLAETFLMPLTGTLGRPKSLACIAISRPVVLHTSSLTLVTHYRSYLGERVHRDLGRWGFYLERL